jgi:hypothetical protein
MSTQPKALFLADVIEADHLSKAHHDAAASELRRLYGENNDLREGYNALSIHQVRLVTRIKSLYAERNELLTALKNVMSHPDGGTYRINGKSDTAVAARAAIAQAERMKIEDQ